MNSLISENVVGIGIDRFLDAGCLADAITRSLKEHEQDNFLSHTQVALFRELQNILNNAAK